MATTQRCPSPLGCMYVSKPEATYSGMGALMSLPFITSVYRFMKPCAAVVSRSMVMIG